MAEVVAYVDQDGDLWRPAIDGSNELCLERLGGQKNERSYIEQHYGPLRPLIVDPSYQEPSE